MAHKRSSKPKPPAPKEERDIEAVARQLRVEKCEREVFAAIAPILKRYHCRLGTVQEVIDGRPGPVRILVFPEFIGAP